MPTDATVPPVPGAPVVPPAGGDRPRQGGRGRWVLGAVAGLATVVLGMVAQVAVILVGVQSAGVVLDVGWMTWTSALLAGAVAALVAQPLADARWRRRVAAAVPGALLASGLTLAGALEADRMAGVPWTTHLVAIVGQPLVVLAAAGAVALLVHLRRGGTATAVREATPPVPGGAPDAD